MTTDTTRREVTAFALAMEEKLRINDHKGHWRQSSVSYLRRRLHDEVAELMRRLDDDADPAEVLREAADVANFAMMIADVVSTQRAKAPARSST